MAMGLTKRDGIVFDNVLQYPQIVAVAERVASTSINDVYKDRDGISLPWVSKSCNTIIVNDITDLFWQSEEGEAERFSLFSF